MTDATGRRPDPEKHGWIRELVPDKTFADIGGLWGTVNETVSVALRHGAREATMVDVLPQDDKWWTRFHERCDELGVSGYRSVVGDICNNRLAHRIGRFDVTHCSGVIYHVPNPVDMIRNLIAITRERFILSSMVLPERIESRAGALELYRGQCLLVPTLSEPQRLVLSDYFSRRNIAVAGINREVSFLTRDGRFHPGPWWWLFTAETLAGMCAMFDVDVERTAINSFGSATVLARLKEAA